MEVVEDTPLLKQNKNTIKEVRKDLKLSHDDIVKLLDSFEEWIDKQQHFTMNKFDRHYLEMLLIFAKGSLERAKTGLDKFSTMKTLLPNFFTKCDAKNELKDTSHCLLHGTMPKLLKDNYRLYIVKLISSELDASLLMDYYRFTLLIGEYVKRFDYTHGNHCLRDLNDVNVLNFITKINIVELRNMMSLFMEGTKIRIKAIYILSSSKTIDAFVSLLKQTVSAKVGDRIHALKSLESLHKFVPKEYLPTDYGGDQLTMKQLNDNWVHHLSSPENVEFFKQIHNARTDEKYRLTEVYNDQVLGLPGSFRTLSVD